MNSPSVYHDPVAVMRGIFDAEQRDQGLYKTRGLEVLLPSVEIVGEVPDGQTVMRHLEAAIRTAYKSEGKIGPGSDEKLLRQILSVKHESTLEHFQMTFRIVTNRGVTHEIVRHRIGHSYTQESTRYVSYGKVRPRLILPWHLLDRSVDEKKFWLVRQRFAIMSYLQALKLGWKAQDARGFLPNDLKTEIVWTMNVRSARAMLALRTAPTAHPDMQVVAREILRLWHGVVPLLFQDLVDAAEGRVQP